MKNFIERLEDLKFTATGIYANGYNSALNKAKELFNELHPSTEIPAPEPEKQAKEGSFKVRVTKADRARWYKVGEEYEVTSNVIGVYRVDDKRLILKSDCEIIPETTVIKFDYDRWKKGDYLRVVTRDGREVKQLTEFECRGDYSIYGSLENEVNCWFKDGRWSRQNTHIHNDLHLKSR